MAADPSAKKGALPFAEQIDFFKDKVRLPTQSWTDLWHGEHSRAFVVAGATKDSLLVDLQEAMRSAIEDGTTLEQFRKAFDQTVAKNGWAYNGGRNWRTRVIYDTNLQTSYMAGRYKQAQEIKEQRPYWEYLHVDPSMEQEPRPEHMAWNHLILSADDAFWKTHFPPNGWGCKCSFRTLAPRDLKAMGKARPDQAPPVEYRKVTVGTQGPTPREVEVPVGIDPGFGHNVGESAWGQKLSQQAMDEFQQQKASAWKRLTPGDWQSYGLSKRLPTLESKEPLGPQFEKAEEIAAAISQAIGGGQKVFQPGGIPVLVNADTLAAHIDPARSPFIPALPEVLSDPQEVWLSFEQHAGTGAVVLRSRIIRVVKFGKYQALLVVANARGGMLESWTFVPMKDLDYLNRQRAGKLLLSTELGPSLSTRGAGGSDELSERAPAHPPEAED